ncbi:hypothetical protein PHAVU_006G104400 [Phaseolus vulgaris]|uniref:C2 domain-containing protein n=1 Tax=Phaseolus vulgaris TaxID=3885 RepID=V7BMJ2_PHAVU|nr:hypothetical protein PHAVU_006G104400g [Phaseolus vulgaris]ESW19199.1 hypothetical protein PHAVU_006G104400g [Phaseolus vulgaris]
MSQVAGYQLLEINVMSAQDLPRVSKPVRAYAVGWLHPDRKLTTQVDQEGHTNPTWNEKFVFRVDDQFLDSDDAVITIEIYTQAWLSPVLIGTVGILVSDLLPTNRKPKLRFVAVQIRRPSGRTQGILNIGVTLLDSTMRSMPLYSDLSSSDGGYYDPTESRKNKHAVTEEDREEHSPSDTTSLLTLQRYQSEKNDSTIDDYAYHGNAKRYFYDEQDSEVGVRKGGVFNGDSLISDVGPSPSMVASAISKGLYPMPPPRTADSSTIDGWSENSGTEVMKKKMEKWRMELSPAYEDYDDERRKLKQTSPREGQTPRGGSRRGSRRGGPSCFGSVFGCEITITCAKGNRRRKNGDGMSRLTAASSELTYDESYI